MKLYKVMRLQFYINIQINRKMNSLQETKNQLEADKQKLIQNIELKLQQLRKKRKQLQQKGISSSPTPKQTPIPIIQSPNQLSLHLQQKQSQVQSVNKLKQLQILYNKKKSLEELNIYPLTSQQINKHYKNPKILSQLNNKQPNKQEKIDKKQVIQQEMDRIAYMLKKNKINKKQIQNMQQYYYKQIMNHHHEHLQKYQQLLKTTIKRQLSRLEKQQIIQIVFQTLKQFNNIVKKTKLRDFLLANQNFCSIFYITQQQIFNDLQVYQTIQQDQMNHNQVYEYIKSIQLTNPLLNPSLKKPIKKKTLTTIDAQPQKLNASKSLSQLKAYLQKLFKYFDQHNQKCIQREKFIVGLKKAFIFDVKKFNQIKKQNLIEFAQYIKNSRQIKQMKSYYKQLQGKFIGWTQIQELLKMFHNQVKIQPINPTINPINNKIKQHYLQLKQDQLQQQQNQQNIEQKKLVQQQVQCPERIQKGTLQDYFNQYGWKNKQNQKVKSFNSELNSFDKYYHKLSQKHGNQIQWQNQIKDKLSLTNNQQFKQDFKKLQSYIKQFQKQTH